MPVDLPEALVLDLPVADLDEPALALVPELLAEEPVLLVEEEVFRDEEEPEDISPDMLPEFPELPEGLCEREADMLLPGWLDEAEEVFDPEPIEALEPEVPEF